MRKKKQKPDARPRRLRKLLHLHTVVTILSVSVYTMLSVLDPGFFSYDVRQKIHALADDTITVTATVLSPPVQPIVSAVSECDTDAGILSVKLDWANDANSVSYDIDRDSSPLVGGLTDSFYRDTNVTLATAYQYVVTARGPMGPGFATSNPVAVTTLAECEIVLPAPTVSILTFDGQNVNTFVGTPTTEHRRPLFSGTTNIPGALVQIVVGPLANTFASLSANGNGYWQWQPPLNLPFGAETFTVTVIDPNDVLRQATNALSFIITEPGKSSEKDQHRDTDGRKKKPAVTEAIVPVSPLDFSLVVTDDDHSVVQGQAVDTRLHIIRVADRYRGVETPVRYSLVDERGEVVGTETRKERLIVGRDIPDHLPVPLYVAPGQYFVRAEILVGGANISRTAPFSVTALPFISIGGLEVITYDEAMRGLGWSIILLMTFFLFWIFLFLREFFLYLQGDGHITEWDLKRAGYFDK